MIRTMMIAALGASLAIALSGGDVSARGFGGGFRGGSFGGFRGGDAEGSRGGEVGGLRYGGASSTSFSHTPSFSSFGHEGEGVSYGGRGLSEGMDGGRLEYGSRSGSYSTGRGTCIDYGAAGIGGRGPDGGMAGRGVDGVHVTTPGGRSFTDVGRAGGAVGPGGNAVGGRSNLEAASEPRGTAVDGSRSVGRLGPGGAFGANERGGVAAGPGGVAAGGSRGYAAAGSGGSYAAGSRGGVAYGQGGAVAGRSYGASSFRPYGYNAYGGYHAGWVHGYWSGHENAAWGWRNPYWGGWGLGLGAGLGWGLASWGCGSSLYGMGYMRYVNSYYAAPVVADSPLGAVPYDYSQPINTVSAPAEASVTDPAIVLFDAGRASFRQENYAVALGRTDEALAKLPDDTTLHEFRALCLFALARYDEAAATLYAVLSVGPGWDWTTLISLYPEVGVYTAQLRALEADCAAEPGSASARFVLTYHYLTEGHAAAATDILKQVVALKPNDTLSAKLLRQLDLPKDTSTAFASASPPTDPAPPPGASIAGTWSARPTTDTTIALTVQPGGDFIWQVTKKGRTHQYNGASTYGEGILALAQTKGPALVGHVVWTDPSHITFRVVGDGPADPGLNFAK